MSRMSLRISRRSERISFRSCRMSLPVPLVVLGTCAEDVRPIVPNSETDRSALRKSSFFILLFLHNFKSSQPLAAKLGGETTLPRERRTTKRNPQSSYLPALAENPL